MDALRSGTKSFLVDESRKNVDDLTSYEELLKTPLYVSRYEYKLHEAAAYFAVGSGVKSIADNHLEHCVENTHAVKPKAGDFYVASSADGFLASDYSTHAHTANGIVFSRVVESVEEQQGAKCARVHTRAIHPTELLASFHVHTGRVYVAWGYIYIYFFYFYFDNINF